MKKLFIFLFIFLNIFSHSKSDDFFEDITNQILENQPRLSYGVSDELLKMQVAKF